MCKLVLAFKESCLSFSLSYLISNTNYASFLFVCLSYTDWTVDVNQGRLYKNSTFVKFGCQQSPSGLHIVPTFEFPTLKLSATPPNPPPSARG